MHLAILTTHLLKSMFNITTAYTLGANVIEKHFTLNKKSDNDHYHSMILMI